MAIALRSTLRTDFAGGVGTGNKPAGVVSGDVLLALVGDDSTGLSTGLTGPSGWVCIGWSTYEHSLATPTKAESLWMKVAGGSEPASYTWTGFNSTQGSVEITAFSGCHATDPVVSVTTRHGGNGAVEQPTFPPNRDPFGAGASVLYWGGNDGGGAGYTPPAGYTEIADYIGGAFAEINTYVAWKLLGAGAQDVPQVSASAGTAHGAHGTVSFHVILRDAAAVAAPAAPYVGSTNAVGRAFNTALQCPTMHARSGDLMLVVADCNDTTTSLTPPGGWSVLQAITTYGGRRRAVYYRTAGASEPLYYTWTQGANNKWTLTAIVVKNADVTPSVNATGSGTSAAATAPTVTTTQANALVLHVAIFGTASATSQSTPPAGYSETFDSFLVDLPTEVSAKAYAAAGATGAQAATVANAFWIASHLAINVANVAPNSPTLTVPAAGSTIDANAGFTATDVFSDPNTGDTRSAKAWRQKVSGAGAYSYWNPSTGLMQGTVVWFATASDDTVIPPGKMPNAFVYNWSAASQDALGLQGPFAADSTFVASTAATVTATGPSGTVTDSTRPPITWSVADPESDPQEMFEVQIESGTVGTSPGAGTLVVNSTQVASPVARSWVPTVDLANGTTYRAFIRARTNGQWSAWVYTTFTLALNPPAQPTHLATPDPVLARIAIAIQGRDNMLSTNQASLETDTTGWAVASNCTLSRSTAQAAEGVASLALTSVAAGNMSANTPTGVLGFPVTAGDSYSVLTSARAAAISRTARVWIQWWTAAGALVSETATASVVTSAAAWGAAGAAHVAPATAAFATVKIDVLATATAGEVHYFDKISLAPGTSPVWTRGGLAGVTRFRCRRSRAAAGPWENVPGLESVAVSATTQKATVYDRTAVGPWYYSVVPEVTF